MLGCGGGAQAPWPCHGKWWTGLRVLGGLLAGPRVIGGPVGSDGLHRICNSNMQHLHGPSHPLGSPVVPPLADFPLSLTLEFSI